MEILIGAIILHLIGLVLKRIKFIKDNFIPIILTGIGVLGFYIYYAIIHNVDFSLIVSSGVAAASASVFIHQVIKQLLDLLPLDKGTKETIMDVVEEVLPKEDNND